MGEAETKLWSEFDHMAVTAPTLAAGVEWVEQCLGVPLQTGGRHPRMGTHNALLRLGDALYLEVIAIDPEAPSPGRPRWFRLDELTPHSSPQLATWVVRTGDVAAAVAAGGVPMGSPEPMTRGSLRWRFMVSPDGRTPLDGIAPTLIQWDVDVHPASTMEDRGCSLVRLEGYHPEADRIARMLQAIGFRDQRFVLSALGAGRRPYLVAFIQTPGGIRRLGPSEDQIPADQTAT